MGKEKYSDESLFCVKYLQDKGYLTEGDLTEMAALLDDLKVDFKLVKVRKDFFTALAEQLRALWPEGEKDGKYPWRGSVANLAKRLEILWQERGLKDYTIENCLTCARSYLAQFREDARYMMILKNFIYINKTTSLSNGKNKFTFESKLADMLEAMTEEEKAQDEWEEVFSINQGRLI